MLKGVAAIECSADRSLREGYIASIPGSKDIENNCPGLNKMNFKEQ